MGVRRIWKCGGEHEHFGPVKRKVVVGAGVGA